MSTFGPGYYRKDILAIRWRLWEIRLVLLKGRLRKNHVSTLLNGWDYQHSLRLRTRLKQDYAQLKPSLRAKRMVAPPS